jgi:hypothetical protein
VSDLWFVHEIIRLADEADARANPFLAGELRRLLANALGKALPHLPVRSGADHHHGGLTQLLGQVAREPRSPLEESRAVDPLSGKDLDDVGVLQVALPEPQRLREGGADELGARQVGQGASQVSIADPLAGLLGEVRADVEADGAGTCSHPPILHGLKQRGKFHTDHCYLYFEVDRGEHTVTIETSWLPYLRPVREALLPLGFERLPRGAWRACVGLDDFMGVARRTTRALELLLTEATCLIASDEVAEV